MPENKEYKTMDDSVKSYVKMGQDTERRNADLANMITDYAQKHRMSFEEVMKCVEITREVFYSSAMLNRLED